MIHAAQLVIQLSGVFVFSEVKALAISRYDIEIRLRFRKEGDEQIEAVNKELDRLRQELKKVLAETKTTAKQGGLHWTELKSQIDLVTGGLKTAYGALRQVFEAGREGAVLNQLEDSFERMNEQVYRTPGLLDEMRAAVRGTVGDAQLMSSVLTITAGTGDEMARALASAAPVLASMAKAASDLNPMLGSTSFQMESLSLAAKRQSKLIADNAGLNITMANAIREVHPALQTLANTYEELPENLRFLNEMLFQGQTLIRQAGGEASTQADAYQRLSVEVKEAGDEFKRWLSEALIPTVEYLNKVTFGGYGDEIQLVIDKQLEQAHSTEQLIDLARRLSEEQRGTGDNVTGTSDEIAAGLDEVKKRIALTTGGWEEYRAALYEAGITGNDTNEIVYRGILALAEQEQELDRARTLAEQYGRGQAQQAANAQRLARAELEVARALSEHTTPGFLAVMAAVQKGNEAYKDQKERMDDARASTLALKTANDQLAATLKSVSAAALTRNLDLTRQLNQQYPLLAAAQGEWVNTTRNTSQQMAEINEQLAGDLTDEQADAWREILSTVARGSAEWVAAYDTLGNDLTDSQRDALTRQIVDLEAANGERIRIYTGDVEALRAAKTEITNINNEIAQSHRETAVQIALAKTGGLWTKEVAELAIAIGFLSKEQALAQVQASNTETAISDLNKAFFNKRKLTEDGIITEQEYALALKLLESGAAKTAEQALAMAGGVREANDAMLKGTEASSGFREELERGHRLKVDYQSVGEATNAAGALETQLKKTAGDYKIHFSITSDPVPAIPSYPGGGATPIPQATGGDWIVRRPTLFLAGEAGAERATFTPLGRGRGNAPAAPVYNDFSQTHHHYNSREAAALGLAFGHIEKRRRLDNYMGVQ